MPHEQPRDKGTWSLCVNILRDKQVRKKASFRELIKENKPLHYACNMNQQNHGLNILGQNSNSETSQLCDVKQLLTSPCVSFSPHVSWGNKACPQGML